ncbi:MAG TPA: UDP-N-acetylglucosamine 2-epimerase (non-hydrolyzing) [Candidatus Sulfotelmatobacter sp.]|nr:UDP-N-acetylglucosamine 2-epimerase (non-hydrolyzing) [Candidatus Sulfotelmatobacter sp.]
MAERRKIMTIFGTRPEGTKMVPVIKALNKRSEIFDVVIASTGQHREQLDQVFAVHNLKPHHDLAIMQPNQTLAGVMSRLLTKLDELLAQEKPDMVLVHGDTSSTAAGSLAAFYHQIPVGHVEAGLRTYDKYSPWPEEINRRMAGVIADVHFATTSLSRQNLLSERVPAESIFVAGQTGVDATLEILGQPYEFETPDLRELDFKAQRVIAVTAHRRENYGEPMTNMFRALRDLVDKHPDTLLIYPVHLAPAVRNLAFPILGNHERIMLLDPIPHPDMLHMMAKSHLVMADSGGLQEETPCMGVPQVLMRETTERPEAVEAGVVIKSGTSYEGVFSAGDRLLSDKALYERMAKAKNPFGDGLSSERIADYLAWRFKFSATKPTEFSPA